MKRCLFWLILFLLFSDTVEAAYKTNPYTGRQDYYEPSEESIEYPGVGIAISTGSAWGTSLTDNHTNWDTAYGWGNHALAGYLSAETDPYAVLLAGRSGGQTIKGGTQAGDDLSFWTNATGTVGSYFFTDLTDNGFLKTSGGTGLLSVDTSTYLTTVDISANSNLAVTAPITLSGDTVGIDVSKDIVAGTGLSGGANDVLPGADSDVTLSIGANQNIGTLQFFFNGNGAAISAGTVIINTAVSSFAIDKWVINADVSGNAVVDIKYNGSSVAGTEKPTLSGAQTATDTSLTTWTDTGVGASETGWTATFESGTVGECLVTISGQKT